jgi:hypothetical protein
MRSTKVLWHKESDGTDVAQTPKEDCVLAQHALNSILLTWRSFCSDVLILIMAAKYPGCLHSRELNHPELLFSCISPMLCVQRAAKLLGISLDMQAFHKSSRDCPAGHDIFPANSHASQGLAESVAEAMKSAAASFTKTTSTGVQRQLVALTDDVILSSSIILKSHCPTAVCQAVGTLLETRMFLLSAAGLVTESDDSPIDAGSNRGFGEYQAACGVCDDAFISAVQPENLSEGVNQRMLRLSPIIKLLSFRRSPTQRKETVVQFKKMSAALHSFDIELLNNSSPCVLVMIECLLALSDVANGSSKCFFLSSALDWMESLWKSQEATSIRAIRSLQKRNSTAPHQSLLRKLRSAPSFQPKSGVESETVDQVSFNDSTATPTAAEQTPVPEQTKKKYVNKAKADAAELSKEQERQEESIKNHDRVYKRTNDKLYHASVFVSFMCSCAPTAIMSKHRNRWSNLISGFELAYRKFISCVKEDLFSATEVKRVLWLTLTLMKPLATEYRVLHSCHNPSAPLLLEAFNIFSRFAVTLDEVASSYFDDDYGSNYEPIFPSHIRRMIFILSLNQNQLHNIFPHCPSVSEATLLLAEGSYYQLLHGEMKALTQEMQDSVETLEGPSVVKALSLFAQGKKYADPQQRRDEEALAVIVLRLKQYAVSDDFLSVNVEADTKEREENSVAMLIVCLMVHRNMHLQDVTLNGNRTTAADENVQGSECINLKYSTISHDSLHCLCTLLQQHGVTSVNCCNATLSGGIPPSFAQILKTVSRLDLQAIKFRNLADDYIMRKILSNAVSATHVNLTYTHGVADEELFALANASGTHLTSLQICQNNSITDYGLCYLATRCPSLQHLHVLGCDRVAGHFIDFVAAYCPALATLDVNFSNIQHKSASLLPQLTGNHSLRQRLRDIDLILKLGVLPSLEDVGCYLQQQLADDHKKSQSAVNDHDSNIKASKTRSRLNSAVTHVKFASAILSTDSSKNYTGDTQATPVSAMTSSASTSNEEVVKVSVAEANRVFGNLERVNEKALLCIEQWISLLYGPSESNRAWLGRAEFAPDVMSKYDAANDDYLVINEEDPEFEVQFNDMLQDFTRRGLDSEQCVQEVKAVLLKKRIAEKENVMAERRVVAEMERDRRTLSTRQECAVFESCKPINHCSRFVVSDMKKFITCLVEQRKMKTLSDA